MGTAFKDDFFCYAVSVCFAFAFTLCKKQYIRKFSLIPVKIITEKTLPLSMGWCNRRVNTYEVAITFKRRLKDKFLSAFQIIFAFDNFWFDAI